MAEIKEILLGHTNNSVDMRRAANSAENIATGLRKLNAGPTFDHERDTILEDVIHSYNSLKAYMERTSG